MEKLPALTLAALLVVLCCTVPAVCQSGFLNIDCGSTTSYVDSTGLEWKKDSDYIPELSGQNHESPAPTDPNFSELSELKTLRAFDDSRAKNCYALPVKKNSTYLLRATFFYGNYDNAAKPPTFQVSVEATVVENITTSATAVVYTEHFYLSQSNVTFLCLIRDGSKSTPFISAISVKPVDVYYSKFDDYLAVHKYLSLRSRLDFGGSGLIRYPEDKFDRYWHAEGAMSSYLRSTTTPVQAIGTDMKVATAIFRPPSAVLQTAVTTTGNLTCYMLPPGSATYTDNAFLLLHFAELDASANSTTREFNIHLGDGRPPTLMNPFNKSDPPAAFARFTWMFWDLTIGPSTLLTLSPTAVSRNGPILNALELFSISDTRYISTLDRDALAIEKIKESMSLTEWTGDPCLPSPHPWVQCSDGTALSTPKITAINLSGYKLKGPISPSFAELLDLVNLSLGYNELTGSLPNLSALVNLKALHLEDNNLSGSLPNWLASLPLLKELTIQNNNFSGAVPAGLLTSNILFKSCPGNQLLDNGCKDQNIPKPSKPSNLGVIIGATVGGVVFAIIIVVVGVFFGCRCYRRHTSIQNSLPAASARRQDLGSADHVSAKPFTYAALAGATNNFATEIGRGGFGPVYHGTLPDGREVAVKVSDASTRQGEYEFTNEVVLLSRVHHRNLVALLGYCQENQKQILVYEYLQNGSLHDQLHEKRTLALDWRMRLNIALNAAQGLEYLHSSCTPSIIHRDVKSSNILLTGPGKAVVAKVADFGLSRTGPQHNATHVSTAVRGTAGYLDPQYFDTQQLNPKSDVFSLGVVILELITGRLPINSKLSNRDEWNVCEYVRDTLGNGGNIDKIVDPAVRASRRSPDSLWKAAEVALRSVEPRAVHRPTMAEVVEELRAAIAIEDFPGGSSHNRHGSNSGNTTNPSVSTGHSSVVFYESDNLPQPR